MHASLVTGAYREHSDTKGEGQAGEGGGLPRGRESGQGSRRYGGR
jgi:hypothetical protein